MNYKPFQSFAVNIEVEKKISNSIVYFTKYIEALVHDGDHLMKFRWKLNIFEQKIVKQMNELSFNWWITFLNWSRLPEIMLKHSITTGFCALIIVVGSIRWTLTGNKYQSHWSMTSLISPSVLVNCCPSSQQKNTIKNTARP